MLGVSMVSPFHVVIGSGYVIVRVERVSAWAARPVTILGLPFVEAPGPSLQCHHGKAAVESQTIASMLDNTGGQFGDETDPCRSSG